MHTYIKSTVTEPPVWTVGFYEPSGAWHPVRAFSFEALAAAFTSYLNGGTVAANVDWD